jgi:hypothetical protein
MQLWNITSAISTTQYSVTMQTLQVGASLYNVINQQSLAQLWQYTYAGQLLSALNASWAITADASSNAVTVQPVTAANPYQIWAPRNPGSFGVLVNQGSGMALTMGPVLVQAPVAASNKSQLFQETDAFNSDSWMLTTITNNTPNNLFVSGTAGEGTSALNPNKLPFVAGASLTFWSYYSGGLETSVQIWDPRWDSSVASFDIHLNWRDSTWISDTNWVNGYSFSQTTTTDPPNDSTPALATVVLAYNSQAQR